MTPFTDSYFVAATLPVFQAQIGVTFHFNFQSRSIPANCSSFKLVNRFFLRHWVTKLSSAGRGIFAEAKSGLNEGDRAYIRMSFHEA